MVDPEERRARASGRSAAKPSNGDEIQERYLRRAISEINELGDELLALGDELHVPVLGSGHPLGDVFLLKSLQRLAVDPLAVYGTNCLKFGTEDPAAARGWLTRELHIVQPKLVVAMGDETVAFVNALDFPLSSVLDPESTGELQELTPTIDALVTPDIDASLDEQSAKTRFWNAFKALGAWWSELPPY